MKLIYYFIYNIIKNYFHFHFMIYYLMKLNHSKIFLRIIYCENPSVRDIYRFDAGHKFQRRKF